MRRIAILFVLLAGCVNFGEATTNTQFDRNTGEQPTVRTPQQECHPQPNGGDACGYNCRMSSMGVWACASTPALQCTQGSDGSWSCP